MTKTLRQFKEDGMGAGAVGGVAVNNAGGGQIAGIGVGPQGEPGVDLRKKHFNPLLFKAIEKRKAPVMVKEEVHFAGQQVFPVDADTFHNCRMGKRKWARWAKYVGDNEIGKAIKDYGYKNPSKPIILQHKDLGHMLFLRYGHGERKF